MNKRLWIIAGVCAFFLAGCNPQEPSVADAITEKKEVEDSITIGIEKAAEANKSKLEAAIDPINSSDKTGDTDRKEKQ